MRIKTTIRFCISIGIWLGFPSFASDSVASRAKVYAANPILLQQAGSVDESKRLENASPGPPRVGSARFQAPIDEAWKEAESGVNPAMTCAGVKGRAVAFPKNVAAQRAAYVCGVDIPVRYFQTFLDQIEAGEKTCPDFMMAMATELGSMTITTDSIRNMAESMTAEGRDDEAQAAATEALDAAIREAAFDQGPGDTQRIVKNRLADRTRQVCPDYADYILR